VVRDELSSDAGKHAKPLFASRPPSVWMLWDAGFLVRRTTTGKLAEMAGAARASAALVVSYAPRLCIRHVYPRRVSSCEVAKAWGRRCAWGGDGHKPLEILRRDREAKLSASDDPGGHGWAFAIDDDLMNELSMLKRAGAERDICLSLTPDWQDACGRGEFHKRLGLTGVILRSWTAMRAGAAPFDWKGYRRAAWKLWGWAKNTTRWRVFYPERIVRACGYGDILSLTSGGGQSRRLTKEAAADLERKLRKRGSRLEDFGPIETDSQDGAGLEQLVDMLPKMGPLQNLPKDAKVMTGKLKQVEAIHQLDDQPRAAGP